MSKSKKTDRAAAVDEAFERAGVAASVKIDTNRRAPDRQLPWDIAKYRDYWYGQHRRRRR